MSNSDLGLNATPIPNEFLNTVPMLGNSELRVILALFRDMLSVGMLVRDTGLSGDEVREGLAAALERGFVAQGAPGVYGIRYIPEPEVEQPLRAPGLPAVSSARRLETFRRDNFTCRYCGAPDLVEVCIDHVFPKSRGGNNDLDNLATCCRPCNTKKAARTPEEARMPLLPIVVPA